MADKVKYELKGDLNQVSVGSAVVDGGGYSTDDEIEIAALDAYAAETKNIERVDAPKAAKGDSR